MADKKREGIPTEYKGVRFRSRLEACWARFFDLVGWQWEYEPFDMPGYIPDFVLTIESGQIVIDIKPLCCRVGADAPEESEFDHRAAWLHANLPKDEPLDIIILGTGTFEDGNKNQIFGYELWRGRNEKHYHQDWCWLGVCPSCKKLSFSEFWGSYACRLCGHYDGSESLIHDVDCQFIWSQAKNFVQWRGDPKEAWTVDDIHRFIQRVAARYMTKECER